MNGISKPTYYKGKISKQALVSAYLLEHKDATDKDILAMLNYYTGTKTSRNLLHLMKHRHNEKLKSHILENAPKSAMHKIYKKEDVQHSLYRAISTSLETFSNKLEEGKISNDLHTNVVTTIFKQGND